MSHKELTPAELEERVWKEIDDARIVMLGLVGGQPHHMQPMAAFADRANKTVWFYSNRDTDMAKGAAAGHDAMMCVMAKDMEFQGCVHGRLSHSHDQAKIDEYWSPFVAAWFPEGKSDPGLTLLRLDGGDARVWLSNRGPFNYAFEIAKANLSHATPDVGTVADVKLG